MLAESIPYLVGGLVGCAINTIVLTAIVAGSRADRRLTSQKMVFVCSPLRGDYQGNAQRARMYCRQVLEEGCVPYAPHLFFTQFLNDTDAEQRDQGISAGIEMLKRCDEVWVFTRPDGSLSEGMMAEVAIAAEYCIPVRYFSVAGVDASKVNWRAA